MTSKKRTRKSLCLVLSIVMILSMMTTFNIPVLADDTQSIDIVNNGDMENSTYWWHSNGGQPVVSVSDVKHSGSYCIQATGRKNPWEGAAQNLTGNQKGDPVAGTKYHGAAWVMYSGETAPESITFKLSIKRNNGTEDKYDNINQLAVSKGQWTLLEGDYTLPSDTDVSKGVHIYLETTESESFVDFYADDISLTTQEPIPSVSPSSQVSPSPVPSPAASPDKVVALTFDDGPDSTLTAKVLDKLDKYKVPATFMMIGSKLNDSTADIVKRVVDSGCEIGNHSWSYDSMDKMTIEQIQKSVNDTTAAIQKYSGKTPLFFRPPNLALSDTMYDAIDLTFVSGVTANDWVQTTTAEERANAIINGVKDGSIILLHDVQPLPHPTPEALDIIIPTLLSKGYEFVTLSELFKRKGVELSPTEKVMYSAVIGKTPAVPGKNIVNNGDMEKGAEGWFARGSASIAASTDEKNGGTSSLKVTGRTSAWEGPGQYLEANGGPILGKSYNGSAWVMYNGETAPETVTFKLSAQWNNGTEDKYDQIGQVSVTKGKWTKLEGTYIIPSDAVLDSKIQLYIETAESESFVDFYADDVVFQEPEATISLNGSDSLYTDFENADVSGWSNRGEEKVSLVQDQYHNGSYSISATGRTQSWNGPKHTLMGVVNFDKTYQISAYVMYNEGPDTQEFKMSIQKDSGAGTDYINVGSVKATKGKWALIEGEYTVPYDVTLTDIALYFETPGNAADELVDFYIDDVKVSGGDSLDYNPDLTALKSVWEKYFPIGVAIEPEILESPIYSAYIKKHYSSLTAENCMKPYKIQPTEGEFTFADADKIVDFAQANNKLLRFHTLVWHNPSQVPEWLFTDPQDSTKPATSEMLLGRMKTYIETVMKRYTGKIHTYDVVNEVLSDGEGLRGDSENSKWKSIVGDVDKDGVDDDYILAAFKYAFETAKAIGDDKVKFCINDYNLESSSKKLDAMYNITQRILKVAEKEGIGKDRIVVGFQMHISAYSPSVDQIRRSIERIASLGVKVQVTEMDVSIYKSSSEPKKTATEDILLLQAKRYKDIFAMFKDEAQKGNIDTVTLWGADDGRTWLNDFPVKERPDPCLLFNKRLQAKPAFTALTDPDSLPVYRQQINTYKGTPVLGNDIDKLWNALKSVDMNQFVVGTEGAAAKVKTLWDNKNLYILAQVDDSTPSTKDSFEIFLDTNSETTEDNKHYTINSDNSGSNDIIHYTKTGTNGYTVQVAVPVSETSLKEGNKIGIDFRVNDFKADGTKSSVVVWNDNYNKLDTDTSGFGYAALDKDVKLIKVAYGTPVVDGSIDSTWNDVQGNETGVWVSGTSGSTAKFKTLWSDNKLYVLAEVTDSLLSKESANAYQQDSVEIFIDQDNAKNPYYEADDYQIRVNYDNEVSFDHSILEGFKSATAKTEKGYILEAEIPLTAVNAEEGTVMGFDLQVNNDEDGNGSRDSVSIWCDASGLSYKDVSGLGNIILGEKSSNPPPTPVKGMTFSGYVNPDVSLDTAASDAKAGFMVEVVGTNRVAETDKNGFFEIKNITENPGSYIVKIYKTGYLTRYITVTLKDKNVIIGTQTSPVDMWAGDMPISGIQDGIINIMDIVLMATSFNTTVGSEKYNPDADVDKNNSINLADIMAAAKHFNTMSSHYPQLFE